MDLDEGSQKLVADLEDMLTEAKAGEYGDFTNNKYAAPKMALVNQLDAMREKAINGEYDG